MHVLALAVFAVARTTVGMITKREKRRNVVVGDEPDIAALRAVAAVGTAAGHVCFTAKRDRARAAVAAAHIDLDTRRRNLTPPAGYWRASYIGSDNPLLAIGRRLVMR